MYTQRCCRNQRYAVYPYTVVFRGVAMKTHYEINLDLTGPASKADIVGRVRALARVHLSPHATVRSVSLPALGPDFASLSVATPVGDTMDSARFKAEVGAISGVQQARVQEVGAFQDATGVRARGA